jgi:hypothetical protein
MSTIELGTEVGVQQRQPIQRKVQAVMNRDNDKMNGDVHVDETLIGGFSSSWKRSTETKDALMVAIEILRMAEPVISH